jgi:hypothetical protein
MPKLDENSTCHFFETECQYPIPEETLKESLMEESADLITQIPSMDDPICTNCLLATMIELLAQKLK